MKRIYKFRAWDDVGKQMFSFDNPFRQWDVSKIPDYEVWMQFTGLTDKNGLHEVYEGDIIKFKYSVGDFAWEFMNLEEKERENKMLGKTFTCIVTWVEYNAGFELISGDEKSTHTNFPMLYCKTGKVIGNIFQNKL